MRRKYQAGLFLLFFLILGFHLYVSFSHGSLTYGSYGDVRQIESILENGLPFFTDANVAGEPVFSFTPLYHYILAFFSLFLETELVLKVLPSIFVSSTSIIAGYVSFEATKDEVASLISGFLAGTTPALVVYTSNSSSVLSLLIPAFLLFIYLFIQLNRKTYYLKYLIALIVFLTFLHPWSIFLALSLIAYYLIVSAQNLRIGKREPEIITFFFFFVTWLTLVMNRQALEMHSLNALVGNLPTPRFDSIYPFFDLQLFIDGVGFISLILGLIGSYLYFVESKNKTVTLLVSASLLITVLMITRLIDVRFGFSYIGVLVSVLSAYVIRDFRNQISSYRYRFAETIFISAVIILALFFTIPTVMNSFEVASNGPSEDDVKGYEWSSMNIDDATFMTLPDEANAFIHHSNHSVVMNDVYVGRHSEQRIEDIREAFNERFETDLVRVTDDYGVTHILVSEYNNMSGLRVGDGCFNLVYNETAKIYEVTCDVRVAG